MLVALIFDVEPACIEFFPSLLSSLSLAFLSAPSFHPLTLMMLFLAWLYVRQTAAALVQLFRSNQCHACILLQLVLLEGPDHDIFDFTGSLRSASMSRMSQSAVVIFVGFFQALWVSVCKGSSAFLLTSLIQLLLL